MNFKKIRKALTTAILAIVLASGSVTAASAGTGGGTGGGGSTGQQSGFYWASVTSSGAGSAYDQFLSKARWSRAFTESQVQQRVGNLSVCQNSDVIWFLMGPDVWAYNFQGYPTWLTHWMFRGSIQNPQSLAGPAPTASQYQNFIDWDNGVGGMRRDNSGGWGDTGYTIVCSYATYRPPITRNSSSTSVTSSTQNESYTEPYSWSTEITRQPLSSDKNATDGKTDHIGADNLHNQTAVDKKTNFGLLWDSLSSSSPLSPSELTNRVNTALAGDKTLGHATADLDALNQKGMAEGGILNVKEQTKYATVSTSETTTVTTVTNCTHTSTWNSYWAAYNGESTSCSSTPTTTTNRTSSKVAGTLQNTGFWQMLAVHCNPEDFNALLASDSSLIEISGPDAANGISGVVRTKKYASQPSVLDFGEYDANVAAGKYAKAMTGLINFYDKECAFACTNNPSDGGSSANGGVANSGSPGASSSDGVKATNFEFFRDNAPKTIKIDTWWPKDGNGVVYNGEAPVSTTVIRDIAGTPSIEGTEGGKFTMKSKKTGDTLFTGTSVAPNQKNWDSKSFSSPTASLLPGLNNEFTVQSTWASEEGKPHAFNFKWEYAPNVESVIPMTQIGFGSGGAQAVGSTGTVTTPIQGKCYTYFNGTDAGTPSIRNSTISDYINNTGTSMTNKIDKVLLGGDRASAKLTVNFVRSTTE